MVQGLELIGAWRHAENSILRCVVHILNSVFSSKNTLYPTFSQKHLLLHFFTFSCTASGGESYCTPWKPTQMYVRGREHVSSGFCRRYRKLLLWPGTPDETAPHSNDPQPTAELWIIQKDGNLRRFPKQPRRLGILFHVLCHTHVRVFIFLFAFVSEASQSDGWGDDKVPQWRLHQVLALHPAGQHVWVQQADAALWVSLLMIQLFLLESTTDWD